MQYALYDYLRIGGRGRWGIEGAAHGAQEGIVIVAYGMVRYGTVEYVRRQAGIEAYILEGKSEGFECMHDYTEMHTYKHKYAHMHHNIHINACKHTQMQTNDFTAHGITTAELLLFLPIVSISFLVALLTMADARPANSRVLLVSANCESAGDTHASITAKHTHRVINVLMD